MSRRTADWCAIHLETWHSITDLEKRKATKVPRALTTVSGTRVCGSPDCHNIARERAAGVKS